MAHNSSFLPEDYLEKRIARRTNAICLTLFVVVMIGVVAAWFVTGRQYNEVRRQRQAVKQDLADKARQLEKIEELAAQREKMKQKANVTAVLIERVPRDRLLAELVNHMPATMGLLDLELETKVIKSGPRPRTAMQRATQKAERKKQQEESDEPVIELEPTQVTLDLTGLAPTDVEVAQFMTALAAHPLFEEVGLQFSEETIVLDQPVRRFRIEMTVNKDLDLSQVEKTLVSRDLKQNPMSDEIEIQGQRPNIRPARDRAGR